MLTRRPCSVVTAEVEAEEEEEEEAEAEAEEHLQPNKHFNP